MTVAQRDIPAAVLGDLRVVGDKNNRTSLGVQTLEEHQDLKRGTGIQVAGSLVRQDHRRVVHQGTGDRHTLHLATGHLVAFMHQSVSQAHGDQGVDRLFPTLSRFISRIVHERKLYVLYRCRLRQQIVILKNESDLAIPEGRSLPLVHGAHGYPV